MKLSFKIIIALLFWVRVYDGYAQSPSTDSAVTVSNFEKGEDLPYPLMYHAYTHDAQYVYAINGLIAGNSFSADVLRYDPAVNGKWTVLTNKLTPKIRAVAAYVDTLQKIYVMGGLLRNRMGLFTGVEKVDVRTGEVTRLKVSNPMPGLDCGIAVWNNKIYLFGGNEAQAGASIANSNFYEFDPVTEKFKRLANLPRSMVTVGAAVNGTAYTFGGYDQYNGYDLTKNIYAYHIGSNTWKQVSKLPQELIATTAATWKSRIFLAGSFPDEKFIGYYDAERQGFKKLKSNLVGRRYAGAAIVGGKLCVYGGTLSNTFRGLTSVQVADVSAF